MDLNTLFQAKITVANGTASYAMEKGSFRHKERIFQKRALILGKPVSVENGYQIQVTDPLTKKTGYYEIRQKELSVEIYFDLKELDINRVWFTYDADENAYLYGSGETFSEWNLNGKKARIWVAEHQNAKRIAKKIRKWKFKGPTPDEILPFDRYETYYAQPTFVSSEGYYLHVDGNEYMEFDFRKKSEITLYMRGISPIIIEKFTTFPECSRKLADRLGHQPKLPDWVYDGVILASQEGCESIDQKLALAKKHGIPVVGIWSQDWCGCRRTGFGYQVMWNWHYQEKLYPNLPEKIKEWNEKNVRFLGYINPFMAIEGPLYEEATRKGYCVKDKKGDDYLVTITTFPAAMIDLTNPKAWEWYKTIIKVNMIELGMSGWMADFGEYLPVDAVLYSGEDAEQVHNIWPALWAKLNREAVEESGKQNEIFFFTRAGHTGTVENSPVMWTGDHHVDWSEDDGIGAVITAHLSLAMCGFSISHADVGGYTTNGPMKRGRELLLRWEELGVFAPIYRFHEGNQPVNNVQPCDDEELLDHLAKMAQLHVSLKDYLKATVEEASETGIPVIRPVFFHYDEPWAYTDRTEYLLGEDILVAPILIEGARERKVLFPEGNWKHLLTGEIYSQEAVVEAPIGCPPAFKRV